MGFARWLAIPIGMVALSVVSSAEAAPEARTGFQLDYGFGVAFPVGTATGRRDDALSRRYAWEFVPLDFGIGGKPTKNLYVGAYLGFGIGAEGSDSALSSACASGDDGVFKNDVACTTFTGFLGVKARYSFLPGEHVNPWLGYGIGLEITTFDFHDRLASREENVTMSGVDYGRVSFGVDLRSTRGFGWGPYIGSSFGTYTHEQTSIGGKTTHDAAVASTTLHGWVTLGLHFVAFP